MNTIFFDTETTGKLIYGKPYSHPGQPHLVQLAFLVDDEQRNTVYSADYIVKPFGFSIPVEAANIHGITDTIALERGVDIELAVNDFLSYVAGADTVVAHNIDFDHAIICINLARHMKLDTAWMQNKKPFCTMKSSTSLCKIPAPRGRPGYKWPKMMEAYQILVDPAGFEGAHDALADVKACRAVYYALQDRVKHKAKPRAKL